MGRVTIFQRVLPHYRLPFYRSLFDRLREGNIDFQLIYGQEFPGTVPKTVEVKDTWANYVENKYYKLFGQELVWQKIPLKEYDTDLLIIEQANRLLNNYLLQLLGRDGRQLAFWGHGRNMQSGGRNFKEVIKKRMSNKVDWWFAYTDMSKQEVVQNGFPEERITTVNNSIDTTQLQIDLANVSQKQVSDIFSHYKITNPQYSCLYCGGLYPEKNLDFLLSSCGKIVQEIPEFSLIVVGGGPEENKIQEAAERLGWLHYAGPKFGLDLAPFFRCAKALLMPGPVGLVVIDCFVAGVPLFTTDNKKHGPEIAYLRNGENGIITACNEDSYAEAVTSYLKGSFPSLSKGCLQSAYDCSLDKMVTNFAAGIKKCLSMGL